MAPQPNDGGDEAPPGAEGANLGQLGSARGWTPGRPRLGGSGTLAGQPGRQGSWVRGRGFGARRPEPGRTETAYHSTVCHHRDGSNNGSNSRCTAGGRRRPEDNKMGTAED